MLDKLYYTLHPLSYAAPHRATLNPLSCTASYWAKVPPAELHGTPYGLAHPNGATELRCTPLSYALPYHQCTHIKY